jgi:hypothetical protein
MRTIRAVAPPLTLLIGLTLLVLITAAARFLLIAGPGFLFERNAVLVIWLLGMALVALATGLAARAVLRKNTSSATLGLLILTAALLASPLLLVLLQHPSR